MANLPRGEPRAPHRSRTNLVDKSIDVSDRPVALAIGETSVWVLCEKDGKIDRIDPKTNKVTKTIELGAPATRAPSASAKARCGSA